MTKRALLTGFNRAQCTMDYFTQQEVGVVCAQYALIRCFRDMGWEVDQHEVVQGEDISHYDEVFVFLHSTKTFCHCLYSGLYAAGVRPDCVFAFDDWQIDSIMKSLDDYAVQLYENKSGTTADPYKQYYFDISRGVDKTETMKYYDVHLAGINQIVRRTNRLLVPAFAGGDFSLTNSYWPADRIFKFNPNPYNLNRTPFNGFGENGVGLFSIDRPVKKFEWCFPSLVQPKTRKWVNGFVDDLSWPVKYYGARRGAYACTRLREAEMVQEFDANWGVFAPAYYHAGSGWWRPRVLQVADVESILVCDDVEGAVYSEAHVGLNPLVIENMSVSELELLARRQRDGLYDRHPLDKRVCRREITAVLDAPKRL